ncbi:MAG TPA: class I SAM-dependent methyltransferase [Pyrinomonadaceae bacterium]|nr:class I SAM-dependent methyltransferase [Pyrinomonadaceae bacterium]
MSTATHGNRELEQCACANGCVSADEVLHEFDQFRVNRCTHCGLVRLSPRLVETQLGEFYESEYFSGDHSTGYDSYEKDRPLYEKTFARRLKLIRRYKSSERLLDIGCSLGYFLDVAARAGFEVYGLDASKYAVEQCQARFSDRVRHGLLASDSFPAEFFDVVTMFDLFEHVYHPTTFLKTLHGMMNHDGIVVITTPNHRSLLSRVSGRNWVSYKIPEHVYYYTPETLTRMVTPLFEVISIRSEGQYCTLEFLAERLKTISRPLGSAMLPVVRGLGLRNLPVYVNSGSMTMVGRKRMKAEG